MRTSGAVVHRGERAQARGGIAIGSSCVEAINGVTGSVGESPQSNMLGKGIPPELMVSSRCTGRSLRVLVDRTRALGDARERFGRKFVLRGANLSFPKEKLRCTGASRFLLSAQLGKCVPLQGLGDHFRLRLDSEKSQGACERPFPCVRERFVGEAMCTSGISIQTDSGAGFSGWESTITSRTR